MKLENRIFSGLMTVPFILTIAAIILLPDEVAVHWNALGEADGYGSKFIYLILPMVTGFMGLFLKEMFHAQKASKEQKTSKAGIFGMNIGTMVYFNLMVVVFAAGAYCGAQGIRIPSWLGINQGLLISGVLAVISGLVSWKWEQRRIRGKQQNNRISEQ